MTRPDWCPADVWEVAVRMQDELYHWTDEGEAPQQDAETFARGLLDERERCAKVADKWAKDDLQHGETRLAAAYIRDSIRAGTPCP